MTPAECTKDRGHVLVTQAPSTSPGLRGRRHTMVRVPHKKFNVFVYLAGDKMEPASGAEMLQPTSFPVTKDWFHDISI